MWHLKEKIYKGKVLVFLITEHCVPLHSATLVIFSIIKERISSDMMVNYQIVLQVLT